MNRDQSWRNTQTGEVTRECPKKIRYKYWVEGIDEVSNFCRALENFPGDNPDEDLAFKKGNWIELLDDTDEDWWKGRLHLEGEPTEQTGNLPVDLVEKRRRPQWVNKFLNKTVYHIPADYAEFLAKLEAEKAKKDAEGVLAPEGSPGEGLWWAKVKDDDGNFYWYEMKTYKTTYEDPCRVPTPPQSPRMADDKEYYSQVTTEDGERYWYNEETQETTWASPFDERLPPDRWHNNFANAEYYYVDYENMRLSPEKPQEITDYENKLERDRICKEFLLGNPNDILEDYMIYKVIRNVYVTDCLNDIIRKVEIIHEALDLRELVSVVADMVRQVACEEVVDSLKVKLEEIEELERLAALEQAGDDDPNDRDLEPEWLDLYTIPQSVPYVEKFSLHDMYLCSGGPLWKVNKGWRQFDKAYQMKIRVENRYKKNIAKLEKEDESRFQQIEKDIKSKKISTTQGRWRHEERVKKLEEERERLKLVREEERNDPTKVPHKFYQVSDVTMWYGAVCDRGHVLGLELNKNDLEGEIPNQIQKLKHIVSLCLNRNRLVGKLPPQYWACTL